MTKTFNQNIANVAAYYDSRAATYDDSFHPQQAADYLQYISPRGGEKWLDLACGTGLVTNLAARAIGSDGEVIGVDVSNGMLDRAREKSVAMGLATTVPSSRTKFIQGDVTDLSGLAADGVLPGNFDIITCCSALPLPKNIDQTLRHWAEFLKPGGRLIADVPSTRALLNTGIFAKIAPLCGLRDEIPDDRGWIKSLDSLREKLELAGLECERVFVSQEYGSRIYRKDEMEEWFQKTVSAPLYSEFRTGERIGIAKREWLRELRSLADQNGDVHEAMEFFVGIGRKPY